MQLRLKLDGLFQISRPGRPRHSNQLLLQCTTNEHWQTHNDILQPVFVYMTFRRSGSGQEAGSTSCVS